MSLPWVRIDSHIGSHDKILALLADPSAKKWQAAFSYVCAIGWSGDQGTNGKVPKVALNFVHGDTKTARLLVIYRLWEETLNGWKIVNFDARQETVESADSKRKAREMASQKANCIRWHGVDCWNKQKGCTHDPK
jgi:hypothetical protein